MMSYYSFLLVTSTATIQQSFFFFLMRFFVIAPFEHVFLLIVLARKEGLDSVQQVSPIFSTFRRYVVMYV